MALFCKKAGISAHKWRTAAEGRNGVENNGFKPDMAGNPAPKAFMF